MGIRLTYQGRTVSLIQPESVLDALLRERIPIPHSCKSGVCQSCLLQAVEGVPTEKSQVGLRPTWKKENYFLACQCHPDSDLVLRNPGEAGLRIRVLLGEIQYLNRNVLRVLLTPESRFECEPGQFLTLMNSEETSRSYSIANQPANDGFIELHVRLIPGGRMSEWLRTEARPGVEMTILGPMGTCYYQAEDDVDFPIILAGTGTGLAPLYGIIHEALRRNHRGSIRLFHGALQADDLYYVDSLRDLSQRYSHFDYVPCVLNGEEGDSFRIGDLQSIVLQELPKDKKTVRVFLCGAPDLVTSLKTKAFLQGIASKHIFVDAFLPSKK